MRRTRWRHHRIPAGRMFSVGCKRLHPGCAITITVSPRKPPEHPALNHKLTLPTAPEPPTLHPGVFPPDNQRPPAASPPRRPGFARAHRDPVFVLGSQANSFLTNPTREGGNASLLCVDRVTSSADTREDSAADDC